MHHMRLPHTGPEPSLILIERPRCPKCSNRMMLAKTSPISSGYDSHTFECANCNHTLTRSVARDPMKSKAAGWQYSELTAPE
jgi:transposase-like protein